MTADGSRARAWVSLVRQLAAGRGRRLAGEDQVAERAEAEDVEQRGRLRRGELRGQVRAGRALDVGQERRGAAGQGGLRGRAGARRAAGGGVRAGGDLPVGDPQPRVAAVELDVDRAGGERPVVEVTAVRVVECLGELADHLQPGVQRQVRAGRNEVVEALPVRAVPEDDRRAGQELVAVLLGADDPVVRDALQRQVLAVRGALHGLPVLVGRGPLGEVDADPSGVVRGQRRIGGEVVLPGGAGVEGLLARVRRGRPGRSGAGGRCRSPAGASGAAWRGWA